ncbi:isochorismatase family protein [Bifidobacterium pullorum subsp. saeculare]|uniref:Isochorismatase family protein n=1 Tax=Bifidobacterium pullorum subsp. saeculare TaxID=78257 RepID=A0A938WU50_9BIFI|nr:isochorismatase family protein [Bifidobacterium pullorum]MBM6698785.1 isochorismatase family protein [Bifidobacterium pullorum subsp. saeculare]
MIDDDEWLVVIDRQKVFAQSDWSAWACADGSYHATDEAFVRLAGAYGERVAYTRYIAPDEPKDAWVAYFRDWPQFLVPLDDPMYDFTDETARLAEGHPVISRTTFGKWCPELEVAIGGTRRIALCGVATDCCMLLTALAAADAGVRVRLVADACAGSTPDNQRLALETMRLFSPLIEVTDSATLLGGRAAVA